MGKRSDFKRRPQDKYRTFDVRAARSLASHLPWGCKFWEPCAGAGDLVKTLQPFGPQCLVATDLHPEIETVFRLDALTVTKADVDSTGVTHIITNPVWNRPILHEMIVHFSELRPTWLLFDADWIHTLQAADFRHLLQTVVSVGRLCWIEGTNQTGKDNVAWHLFDARHEGPTQFIMREAA